MWHHSTLWIGTSNSGLWTLKDGRISPVRPAGGVTSPTIYTILADRAGRDVDGRDRRLDGPRGAQARTFRTADGLGDDAVLSLHEDATGTLWAGTNGGGLSRIRDDGIVTVSVRDGLYDSGVFSVVEDSDGPPLDVEQQGHLQRVEGGH